MNALSAKPVYPLRIATAKSAFTLIELLVVISIIAILAAIALPVFSTAMEKSASIKDANNLKQLGLGFRSYLNDNDDTLPTTTSGTWGYPIYSRYVTDKRIFQSPFDRRVSAGGANATGLEFVSYGMNDLAATEGNAANNYAKWVSPTLTILVAPKVTGDPAQTSSWPKTANETIAAGSVSGLNGTYGRGTGTTKVKISALFGDMHVETAVKMTDFKNSGAGASATDADKYRWKPLGT